MFFKNIILYRLAEPFRLETEEFNEQLAAHAYAPCPRSENASYGWVSPYGLDNSLRVHALKGFYLLAFCKEEKIIPGTVIREELQQKIAAIELAEDRTVYRKEKTALKEQVIINLRHQAFSRKKITYAYIDLEQQYIVIDTSSRNKAEEICTFLRKTLGTLKLALPKTNSSPDLIMTSWLLQKKSLQDFNIQTNCDMLDAKQKTSMIKCKEQDLNAQEIISHLQSGKQIVKLALNWQEKISFDLCDDLTIKRIKFLDLLQNSSENTRKFENSQEQLDTEFAIMSGEFNQFLQQLWPLFDGLSTVES